MSADITAADVSTQVASEVKRTHFRWYVLVLISLMYMITYMDRSNISVAAPAIAKEFGLSKTEIGLVFSGICLGLCRGTGARRLVG
jgi:sugar phosphate permease